MSSLEGRVMDCSTHSFSLTRAFMGMVGMVSVRHSLFVTPRECQEISFHLIKPSLSIYYVPGIVLNAVTIGQGVWKPPLPKLGPSRHVEASMTCLGSPSFSHATVICSQKSWCLAVINECLSPSRHTLLNRFTSTQVSLQYWADGMSPREWGSGGQQH